MKNYRTGKQEELPMSGEEFVRRFSMHLLPERFLRVRYGGIFRSSRRTERLERCRDLIRPATTPELDFQEADSHKSLSAEIEDTSPGTPYEPDCRRCAMPGMAYWGRQSCTGTTGLLIYLQCFSAWIQTIVSTFDIDSSTRNMVVESLDCIAPSIADGHAIDVACAVVPFACFHDPET